MRELTPASAEIRCRRKRQACLALAIGVTAVLSAAWLSGNGLDLGRRQITLAWATPAQRCVAPAAPMSPPLLQPNHAVEETTESQPTERSRRAVAPQQPTLSLQDLVRRLEADRVSTLAPVLASLRANDLRGELSDTAAARMSLATISESLRTSATLPEAPGVQRFYLGGQATLRGFDFREVHAQD